MNKHITIWQKEGGGVSNCGCEGKWFKCVLATTFKAAKRRQSDLEKSFFEIWGEFAVTPLKNEKFCWAIDYGDFECGVASMIDESEVCKKHKYRTRVPEVEVVS